MDVPLLIPIGLFTTGPSVPLVHQQGIGELIANITASPPPPHFPQKVT